MDAEELSTKRILLLGASGFLGARIFRRLRKAGVLPHILARGNSSQALVGKQFCGCMIHLGDLADLDSLQRIVEQVRPEIIFHAAGQGAHRGEHTRWNLFRNNLLVANNLLIATEELQECRIVYSGTSLAHGKRNEPLREEGVLDPVSCYAAYKAAASLLMQQAARYQQRSIVILNPFAIYGPGEPSGRLIPTAIRAAREGRVLELTRPGLVRDFVFVDDVADAYLKAATREQALGETINIANGRPVANEEVVEVIERQLGVQLEKRVGAYPARETDSDYWCADVSKALRLLDWKPANTLEEGVAKTLTWFERYGFRH